MNRWIVPAMLALAGSLAPAQVVIVDNGEPGFATTGSWTPSANTDRFGPSSIFSFVGTGSSATWTPDLPTTGFYDVYASWTVAGNRARRAVYTINHFNGATPVVTSQSSAVNFQRWNYLGRYEFEAGTAGSVVLTDTVPGAPGTDLVVADAVRFELVTFDTPNVPLAPTGGYGNFNLCNFSTLPTVLDDHPISPYFIVSDMPESFGYPSAGPITKSDGVLFSTELTIPHQGGGYPAAPWNQQVVNGYTTIDDNFDIFMFHIAQPGNGTRPRRMVVYAQNNSATESVDITPQQVLVTDGVVGFVHEMESNLGRRFIEEDFDSTGLGTVTIPAGQGAVIGFSKKFALIGTGEFVSQNVNCFGLLRGLVSGVDPDLDLYIVAIDTTSANVAPVVADMKSAVETILASSDPGAIELESFSFESAPTGGTLRRSTGVFPHKVVRSNLAFDLDTLPGGARFQMGLDQVRTDGCAEQRQTVDALLSPPYLRAESIGNYMTDHRVTIRVQNSGTVARDFDIQFGRADGADIGLVYQVAVETTPPDDATVDAVAPDTQWAGGIQAVNGGNNFESFLSSPLTLAPGEERFVAMRFQILGNSSTPFQLVVPDTRGPEFDRVAANPAVANAGTAVNVTFFASEPVVGNPAVTVGGNAATFSSASGSNFVYTYNVTGGDTEGDNAAQVSANDTVGNSGTSSNPEALLIDLTPPSSSIGAIDGLQVGVDINGIYGASDPLSGVASSRIYYRSETGSWTDGGAISAGTFAITAPTPGRYHLQVVSEDVAGNAESAPVGSAGEGQATVVFNNPGGQLTLVVNNSGPYVFPMAAGAPVQSITVDFPTITAPGTLTVQRIDSQGTLPPTLNGGALIGERVEVAAGGGLDFPAATMLWDYGDANGMNAGDITAAYAADGPTITDYAATATATQITIPNILGFSTWYAGMGNAPVKEWTMFD